MRRVIVIITFFFLISFSALVYFFYQSRSLLAQKVKLGEAELKVEVMNTPEKRSQGLSGRRELCSDCGMLFIFNQPGIYPFWMRRMYFDIDIIWIKDKKVVDIIRGAKAPPKEEFEAPKTTYQSKEPADMVLEVNSGWVEEWGINLGEKVVL